MLNWMELLRNKQYFPTTPSTLVEELIVFLKPGLDPDPSQSESNSSTKQAKKKDGATHASPESVMENLARLRNISGKKEFATSIAKIVDQVKVITKCTSAGSDHYIGSMLDKLGVLRVNQPLYNKQQISDKVTEIIQMIRTLVENARLSDMLRDGKALHSGIGFKGACHAELILVLYLLLVQAEWADVVSHLLSCPLMSLMLFKRAIGVSKRCCPVCAFLLDYLSYIFTGAHHTIWSCSLPTWTPSNIATKMISHFGSQLKEELDSLKQRTDVLFLPCDHSTGSGNLSTSSSAHSLIPIKLKK